MDALAGPIRNGHGRITGNRFLTIGRDAIQVGHATEVRVDDNTRLADRLSR